jgi:hypothetical protein
MPMFIKMDIYRITEHRDGAVRKTKKVAYHWFECGKGPEPYNPVPNELICQNNLPSGNYYYASTLETMIDSRCPKGGVY